MRLLLDVIASFFYILTEVQLEIATIRVWLLNNNNVLIVSISNITRHQYQTFQPQRHISATKTHANLMVEPALKEDLEFQPTMNIESEATE